MIKIYTPEQWRSIFKSPSIIIDDDGYIYAEEDYYKTFRSPIGKVDYGRNYIYGADYSSTLATPIAYMLRLSDVTKVINYGESQFSNAILYIKNNKIYTPVEYFRLFGGESIGNIEIDDSYEALTGGTGNSGSRGTSDSYSGNVGLPFPRLMAGIGLAILVGIIYILTSETRIANVSTILAIVVNVIVLGGVFLKSAKGEVHFEWNKRNFLKGLLTGIGIYIAATAILTLLGIGSNIGTKGSPLSDAAGNQMELSAMFMGLPFLIKSLFVNKPKNKTSGPKTIQKDDPVPKINNSEYKVQNCPFCGQKFRVPANKRLIRVTCPNAECGKKFIHEVK